MDAVAHAIADPVRRDILVLLHDDGALTAGEIAGRFTISRPAISRHLRVLRTAGLALDEASGRQRVYRLDPRPLVEIEHWIRTLQAGRQRQPEPDCWANRLDALETEVRRTGRDRDSARRRTGSPGATEATKEAV